MFLEFAGSVHGQPPGLKLRRATPEDAQSLAAIEVATWRAAYSGLMPDSYLEGLSEAEKAEEWRRSLAKHGQDGRKRVLVAEVAAGPIGFVRVGAASDEAEGTGLVYLLYVLPEYWGLGVGKSLMGAAMAELQELGMREAALWVLRQNRRARGFYEGLGWRPDGRTMEQEYGGARLQAWRYRRAVEV